jgi:polyphosphate kinase 2
MAQGAMLEIKPSPVADTELAQRHLPAVREEVGQGNTWFRGVEMKESVDMNGARDWLEAELADTLDEDYELEISEPALSLEIAKIYKKAHPAAIDRHLYFRELLRLQSELIRLQSWVAYTKSKLVVVFEGRDSAGKGGVIKRISQRLNPRICRVVALPAPTERERSQWYFQRYVPHLPAGGEIVLFDRSWYNRSGVERVMGFADADQVEEFFRDVPDFERMLVRSGITLVKYWFSITDEEQQMRFLMRIHDPMKQWKLSPMDLESRVRWEQYTKAKEEMFARTNIPEAPWYIVEGNDKKRARLNCIDHLLQRVPYEDVPHEEITLPDRVFNPEYERQVLPRELYVPEKYKEIEMRRGNGPRASSRTSSAERPIAAAADGW